MAENSAIEWTTHTFNPWLGCTKVAAGCAHCYAEALMDTRYGKVEWGPNGTRVLTSPANWRKPLKWNRDAEKAGVRARVFCASLADVFENWGGAVLAHDVDKHDGTPLRLYKFEDGYTKHRITAEICGEPATLNDIRRDLFALIDATPSLDWLLLTKRPENVRRMWRAVEVGSQDQADDRNERGELFRRNVFLGTSISTQADADRNVPELLKCRDLSPVLFLSAEPLIEDIDMTEHLPHVRCNRCGWTNPTDPNGTGRCPNRCGPIHRVGGIDWLILGGESGHNARPCNVAWIRSLKEQCAAAGVACFVKQLGSKPCMGKSEYGVEVGPLKTQAPKGGDIAEFPPDLRVREFPSSGTGRAWG